ncbi:MAG: glycosyltransferase, partial [Acidobacteria bacterium]|nr:glycosyltransferase [Acidobacteriota bacterium]
RGLLADEYVDAGLMRFGGLSYRALKWLERFGIRNADQVVVLTETMRDWVQEQEWREESAIEVIPCCVDLAKFKEGVRLKSPDLVYAGSVTGLYLLEEMGRFYLSWKKIHPAAKLRLLTGAPAAEVLLRLSGLGVTEGDVWIGSVDPCDVPAHLSQVGAGLSFRKATFSQIAASPTKIPEYLAAGLPGGGESRCR